MKIEIICKHIKTMHTHMLNYKQLKQNKDKQINIGKEYKKTQQDIHDVCAKGKEKVQKIFRTLDVYGLDIDNYNVVFDIDETLINNDEFILCYGEDKIRRELAKKHYGGYNPFVYELYKWISNKSKLYNFHIYLITRRDEVWRKKTENNLKLLVIEYYDLIFTHDKQKVFENIPKHLLHVGDQLPDLYRNSLVNIRVPNFYTI